MSLKTFQFDLKKLLRDNIIVWNDFLLQKSQFKTSAPVKVYENEYFVQGGGQKGPFLPPWTFRDKNFLNDFFELNKIWDIFGIFLIRWCAIDRCRSLFGQYDNIENFFCRKKRHFGEKSDMLAFLKYSFLKLFTWTVEFQFCKIFMVPAKEPRLARATLYPPQKKGVFFLGGVFFFEKNRLFFWIRMKLFIWWWFELVRTCWSILPEISALQTPVRALPKSIWEPFLAKKLDFFQLLNFSSQNG